MREIEKVGKNGKCNSGGIYAVVQVHEKYVQFYVIEPPLEVDSGPWVRYIPYGAMPASREG